MFGAGSGDWWAAQPTDRQGPGPFPPTIPVPAPFPHHQQVFAPPRPAVWTAEENRVFEAALVEFDGAAEELRCIAIAARIPGKTPEDVREHYGRLVRDLRDIESGVIELPEYADDRYEAAAGSSEGGARPRTKPEERKKGVPWTEEEHRLFLEGLEKYGKGDWRSISRNSVMTRTPTQVASHAQKYFLRQSMEGKKDRRRSSIHDVTRP